MSSDRNLVFSHLALVDSFSLETTSGAMVAIARYRLTYNLLRVLCLVPSSPFLRAAT